MLTPFDQTPEMKDMDLDDPEIRRIIVDGSIAAAQWVRADPDRYHQIRRNYGLEGLGCIEALVGAVSGIAQAALNASTAKKSAALAANIQAAATQRAADTAANAAVAAASITPWYGQWYVIAPAVAVGGLALYAALKPRNPY
jgi:hypothetical protein